MPGGVRINPQQVVRGRWWFLKDSGNTQKPANRLDLFTGKASQPTQSSVENAFSSKSSNNNNAFGGNGNGSSSWK